MATIVTTSRCWLVKIHGHGRKFETGVDRIGMFVRCGGDLYVPEVLACKIHFRMSRATLSVPNWLLSQAKA